MIRSMAVVSNEGGRESRKVEYDVGGETVVGRGEEVGMGAASSAWKSKRDLAL